MIEHAEQEFGLERCVFCSGDYPADFIETITSASATISTEMSPEAFREWLMGETRDPES